MCDIDKYYYFRFKKDFFNDTKIWEMKRLPMYGYHFIVIYLELCGLATESGGILKIRKIGDIPVLPDLALRIGENADTTARAFTYFLNNGLIEKVENEDEIHIVVDAVVNNIGKSSKDADRKRLAYYNENYPQIAGVALKETTIKKYGLLKEVSLSDDEYEDLKGLCKNIDSHIEKLDLDKAMNKLEIENDYKFLKEKVMKEII